MRWREEVILLQEEMRRTLASFKHKIQWWTATQASTIGGSGLGYEEGFSAYAQSQVSVYNMLHSDCEERWVAGKERNWAKALRKKGKRAPAIVEQNVESVPAEDGIDLYDDFD